MRREFNAKVKSQAAIRANGYCEGCGRKLLAGDWHYDHEIPDGLTGEPTVENCKVLCKSCHAIKTKTDVKRIAKAKRNYRKSRGIRKPSRFACAKTGRWKKKLDGTVILRGGK